MRKMLGVVCTVALAASMSLAQDAAKKPAAKKAGAAHAEMAKPAESSGSYVGTWKLNAEKSQYPDPAMKPKSATLTVTKWDANTIAWTYTNVDAKGKTMKASYSAPNDGKPHKVTSSDPNTAMGTFKTSGNDVDITWTDAKGATTGTEHTTLSADGKSFTDKESMKDKSGKDVNFTEVYEKAGSTMSAAKKTTEKK